MKKPVDLNRRFFDFPEGGEIELEQHIALSAALGNLKRWDDILSLRYAILLGEAGSGKTTEFQERARVLSATGHATFFVPVEALATDGLSNALGATDRGSLQRWLNGTTTAVFFLDSVDEAKLQRLTLDRALRRFATETGSSLERARVMISCRVSDWNVFVDRDALERSLGILMAARTAGSSTAPSTSGLHIFGLAPLTLEQVATLASSLGLADPAPFLTAVSEARAGVFVERPVDVEWMVNYWKKTEKLGSLRDLLRFNVLEKLRETTRPQRGLTLSQDRAIDGAAQLAGAAALSGRSSILVSGDAADRLSDPRTLAPETVLKGWSPAEIVELLALPLFDESTLGRVRMHHRTVQDYLAAEWLKALRTKGLPRRQLDRLLFVKTPYLAESIVPPHLHAVAAWIAVDDVPTRTALQKVAPEVLLGEGDPSAIPADDRRRILTSYVDRFRGRRQVFESVERAALRRFAFDGLAETINTLARDTALPDEVRGTLLAIVAEGKITACADVALRLALDPAEPKRVRVEAIRAASSAGAADLKTRLLELVDASDIDHDVSSAVVDALFPALMTVSDLVSLLERSGPKRRNVTTGLQYLFEHQLDDLCDPATRVTLIGRLLGLVRRNDNLSWLTSTLASLLEGALNRIPDGDALPAEINELLGYFEEYKRNNQRDPSFSVESVERLLLDRPQTRRRLFWDRVAAAEREKGKRITRYHSVVEWWWLFELGGGDLAWLGDAARSGRDPAAQVLAFNCLLWAKRTQEGEVSRSTLIETLSLGSQLFSQHLARISNTGIRPWGEGERHQRMMRAIDLRRAKERAESRESLEAIVNRIRDGSHESALLHLHNFGRHAGNKWANFDEETIRKEYGDAIADAAKDGFRKYWRRAAVPAPADWTEEGRVPTAMLVGLTGLSIDIAMGLELSSLSAPERKTALRLVAWELNEFPEWLPTLACQEPDETRSLFQPLLARDIGAKADGVITHKLDQVSRSPQGLKEILAPYVATQLVEKPPVRVDVLKAAFRLVETTAGLSLVAIVACAPERCRDLAATPDLFATWLAFWMNQDGAQAIEFLTAFVKEVDEGQAIEVVEELLARMWEAGDATRGPTAFKVHREAEAVAKLLPIAFRYVPRQGDVWHESTYHPGRRDHAQTMRDRLVASLSSLPPDQSVGRLVALANDPSLIEMRDYLLHKAREQIASHPECLPWSPEQVVAWGESFVRDPRNADELHQAVRDSLEDMKAAIEDGDHSTKAIYNPADAPVLEKPVQVELVKELNREARGRFVAVLEEEVGKENYPDIRIHKPGVTGAIAVEVKIAERWSYNQLKDALSSQLVAQYLRDPASTHGVLVVASSGPPRTMGWDAGTKILPSFSALIEQLKADADQVRSKSGMKEIGVIRIDFH